MLFWSSLEALLIPPWNYSLELTWNSHETILESSNVTILKLSSLDWKLLWFLVTPLWTHKTLYIKKSTTLHIYIYSCTILYLQIFRSFTKIIMDEESQNNSNNQNTYQSEAEHCQWRVRDPVNLNFEEKVLSVVRRQSVILQEFPQLQNVQNK